MKSSCSGVHPLPLILSSFRFLMPKYESVFPPPGVTVGSDPLIRPPVCLVTLSCSGVQSSLSWSRQLVFFVIAGNRQKKKDTHLSDPWPLTPSSRFCLSSSGSGPLSRVSVCVQVRGLVCPAIISGRLRTRSIQDRSSPPIFSF